MNAPMRMAELFGQGELTVPRVVIGGVEGDRSLRIHRVSFPVDLGGVQPPFLGQCSR